MVFMLQNLRNIKLIIVIAIFLSSQASVAAYLTEFNLFYFDDALTAATESKDNRMLWAASLGINVTKNKSVYVGWNINSVSATNETTVTAKYATTDMGPKVTWFFTKNHHYSVSAAYNIQAKGTYDDGTGNEQKWTGTSILADFAFTPEISEGIYIGIKLNYYKSSYTQSVDSSDAYTEVSYGRGVIYPTVSIIISD